MYYIALIPALPLASFILIGLFGAKFPPRSCGIFATLSMLLSTFLAYNYSYQYFFQTGQVDGVYQQIIAFKFTWLQFSPSMSIDMGINLDPISVMLIVVVTTISTIVFLFSMGYMKGENGFSRYFSFLSLFSFSMLALVLSTNILQMYIFWELVGISSYFLIGFYYDKPSAVAAARKAFIVTRFADLGFLIGILILSFHTETLDLFQMIERLTGTDSPYLQSLTAVSFMGFSILTWALLLIFMGGAGKSAMFPLHIWLPDAMEGPTPVSALIHAATMVVAGVFLVARLFPVYAISAPDALGVVAYVGAISSLLAGIIACTQTDIKRVLAFSTISQIGYMILALGVASYDGENGLGFTASMFHLFTHAMFKALLFLCAGTIIHLVHSNFINDMGGLRKIMPITHITFLIACLAIAGIPPFSGFFSKEQILVAAFHADKFLYGIALLTAGITAFYMFRLYFGIFWNKEMSELPKTKEAPLSMLFPLVFLALASIGTGWIPFNKLITFDGKPIDETFHISLAIPAVLIAVIGIIIATIMYKKENSLPQTIIQYFKGFYNAVFNKFYFDELYLFITKNIIFACISSPLTWIEKNIVDAAMNSIANITHFTSRNIRGIQSGQLQQYTFYFMAGVIIFSLVFIYGHI